MTTQIAIIGSGFAALTAARRLRSRMKDAHIMLISPRPEFVFLPSLIWIPTGLRRPEELRFPLQKFMRRHRLEHRAATVTGLSEGGRVVHTDQGDIRNDGLIIGCGGRFIRKLPGIEHTLTICEGIEAAERIRDRLATLTEGVIACGFAGNPKDPSAMRGGPMFELLFGIDTWLRRQKRRDRVRLVFFSPAPRPGQRLGEKAVEGLLAEMRKRNIDTHLGHKMKGFEEKKVLTEGGEIDADLILFMPGMTGPAWAADTELPLSEGGFIQADAHCHVPGFEKVYVAGDAGSYPGPDWMPKQAHMADLQAEAAADNLAAEFAGGRPEATFRPELACIVDTLDRGILVYRTPERNLMFPSPLFHWSKRAFERFYTRRYR